MLPSSWVRPWRVYKVGLLVLQGIDLRWPMIYAYTNK
ncbi:hypothetical protein HU200_040942 [Digitaria exilis]|uniref:Uncharacterized protein n=1 Tax=Digitaria exilis TaxID=1010633 RepID=A0A835EH06_9POAL|nr:hypothetical protein HU200_040942 [Digitaria exilis]